MRTLLRACTTIAALLVSVPVALGGDARADLESIAKDLRALQVDRVAYDRTGRRAGSYWPDLDAEHDRLVAVLREKRWKPADLIRLIEDGDPKVRTLAAVALFTTEDPKLVAPLANLVDDEAETFPSVTAIARIMADVPPPPPPFEKQTVGSVTRLLLGHYLGPAGVHATSDKPLREAAKEYFESRKSREWCGSWFQAWLSRAHQSIGRVRDDRIEAIKALRARVDRVPMPDRAFLLAWLETPEQGGDAFVSGEELLDLLRQAGADALVRMLQRKGPTADPDLQARSSNNHPYKRMQMLVLRNARTLLRKEDVPALLACEAWENDYRKNRIGDPTETPWWRIAAAELDPGRAKEILSPLWLSPWTAIPKWDYQGPADLALAHWRLCSGFDPTAVVEWFHDARHVVGASTHSRDCFLQGMAALPRGEASVVAVAIVRHPRFEELDWGSLERLCRTVNGWESCPVVSEDELRRAWHPLGHHADPDMAAASAKHPKETQALLARLSEWRKSLRAWAAR